MLKFHNVNQAWKTQMRNCSIFFFSLCSLHSTHLFAVYLILRQVLSDAFLFGQIQGNPACSVKEVVFLKKRTCYNCVKTIVTF